MKTINAAPSRFKSFLLITFILAGLLAILFWRSFDPIYVHFANDGPLGQQNTAWISLPSAITGMWDDLNDVGYSAGTFPLSINALIKFALGPVGYAKFVAPVALFILGLGAWTFFRCLKLSSLAACLGALAAMLNSTPFDDACWGTTPHQTALGMVFFALALIVSNRPDTPATLRWLRLALAGFCVGINVIEAADIGALYAIFVALFVFYKTLTDASTPLFARALKGVGRVAVIAVFAGFIAAQTIVALVGTQIQGVAGTAQDSETKAQHWDWATQWSLPKKETLGIAIPGLFGYRMDTPKDMLPALQNHYQGGVYWGGIGRDPAIDRYFDSGRQGDQPPGMMRFSGGGCYAGILVLLIVAWTIAQSFRSQNSLFPDHQKKMLWFWTALIVASLLLAWGRFAPMFYGLLYQLPYFSTIRNPAKFVIYLSWALTIVFAYGVHALHGRYLNAAAAKSADLMPQISLWWAKASRFDRRWIRIALGCFGASLLGWLIYSSQKPALIRYLQSVGYGDEAFATSIATFSIGQLGWFIGLFAVALALVALVLAGYFAGPRAKLGALLLGAFLVFDLSRANLPYIIHWDYQQKYEVGALNPVVATLADKPYEHRVVGLPFRPPQGLELVNEVYRIEWMQHHFPYYNIQCLDWIQMSRTPEDLKAYVTALDSVMLLPRRWELSNTRYVIGAAGFLDVLNQQLDPQKHRFRIAQQFDILPKPGIQLPQRYEELTAVDAPNGKFALFEFTGALPRAKLYSNWQVNTNLPETLKTLASLDFDPAQTVLVSTPEKDLPATAANANTGTVEFQSYAPKHIVLATRADAPAVLLLNDKYDPNWQVTVDGRPASLLRCNFLMRGVYLPPGQHTVAFRFALSDKPLHLTMAAFALAAILSACLVWLTRKPAVTATP